MKKLLFGLMACAIVALVFIVDRLSAGDGAPAWGQPGASISAGPVATAVPVQQPQAPTAESRIQWEYNVVQSNAVMLPADELNELGNQGWEMCGVRQRGQGAAYYYFKREKLTTAAEICEIGGGHPPTVPALPPTGSYVPAPPSYAPTPAAPPSATPRSVRPTLAHPPTVPPPSSQPPVPAADPPSASYGEPITDAPTKPIGSTGVLPSDAKKKPKEKSGSAGRNY